MGVHGFDFFWPIAPISLILSCPLYKMNNLERATVEVPSSCNSSGKQDVVIKVTKSKDSPSKVCVSSCSPAHSLCKLDFEQVYALAKPQHPHLNNRGDNNEDNDISTCKTYHRINEAGADSVPGTE